jgi:cytoskeletal protein RodZ
MSLTLGEKLRQAREERGISISEVAEQTRISAMYLDLIENDDYRTLPGGIFNKGFVKSYAKYVGLDEQEALQDYAQVVAADESENPDESRTYRPEVLTDDRTSGSMIPTVIFAVIILGLMTWGILALVNYIQQNQNHPAVANANTNSGSNANTAGANSSTQPASNPPAMGAIKVEVKTTGEDIAFSANLDGKNSYPTATLSAPVVFEPKEALEFSYLRLKAAFARLTINGKEIPLPTEATDAKGKYIQIKINAETLPQMWQSGRAVAGAPSADATPPTTQAPPVGGEPTPVTAPPATPRTTAVTSRSPQATPSPTRTASPVPVPKATVIIVPSAPKTGATSTPSRRPTPNRPPDE